MRSDYLPDDLKRLWRELAATPVQVSPDDLRREALRLHSGVRLRNWFVVIVCGFIIAAYGFFCLRSRTALERIGSVLSIVGAANMIVQFLQRPARTIPDFGPTDSVRFYRAQLQRQRDFHLGKGIGPWLLPLLPGPIIFNLAVALDRPALAPIIELQMLPFLVAAVIVVPLNLSVARKYQRRLDVLDATSRG